MTSNKYILSRNHLVLFCTLFFAVLTGCKKLVETDKPADRITAQEAYATDASAASVLTKLYSDMSAGSFLSGTTGLSLTSGLLSDELTIGVSDPELLAFYTNNLQSNRSVLFFWAPFYSAIYTCNDAIEQLPLSTGVTASVRDRLIGEAKFMRAFYYFYLTNYYGGVPLVLTTDYRTNRLKSRSDTAVVLQQVITDLIDATTLLTNDYVGADARTVTTEKLRPNKTAALALLARAYLYARDYAKAEDAATEVINNSNYILPSDLNTVFVSNSSEAIWQLQPVLPNRNTKDGDAFILVGAPDGQSPASISQELWQSFQAGDLRKVAWIGEINDGVSTYQYVSKYKVGRNVPEPQPLTEYLMILRLAEVYLIRAEARAQQNNLTGPSSASADIDAIRLRAGLQPLSLSSQAAILDVIAHERQVELFAEMGHRWMDIKRTGRMVSVMSLAATTKGTTWEPYKALFPIPFESMQSAPGLQNAQNPGYE